MAINPSFEVPAEYFYVLGVGLPTSINPEKRLQLAAAQNEADLAGAFADAIEDGLIAEPGGTNRFQAARRLHALGGTAGGDPQLTIPPVGDPNDHELFHLVDLWLAHIGEKIEDFWKTIPAGGNANRAKGHLELVLAVVTKQHAPLIDKIRTWPVVNAKELAGKSEDEWKGTGTGGSFHAGLFQPTEGQYALNLLPRFTLPGTPPQRVDAFIRNWKRFFEGLVDFKPAVVSASTVTIQAPLSLPRPAPANDLLDQFASKYSTVTGSPFFFGDNDFIAANLTTAIETTLPDNPVGAIDVADARAWLRRSVNAINDLYFVSKISGQEEPKRFTIMESLYARGFTSIDDIKSFETEDGFRNALIGTVAYEHAKDIRENAWKGWDGTGVIPPEPDQDKGEDFQPINHDGKLEDCVPPEHRSALGPVQYLKEMLGVMASDNCDSTGWDNIDIFPDGDGHAGRNSGTLAEILSRRFGDIAVLLASRSNLETAIPVIDLVNERLELLVDSAPTGTLGLTPIDPSSLHTLYNTAADTLSEHVLANPDYPKEGHEPQRLFAAIPEHSSPAVPVKTPRAFEHLSKTFTSPELPYSQPLDVSSIYLDALGTTRYATLRRFRKEISEFVLDPEYQPADFQAHLWRYPVRIDIARERLGITPEEYESLYSTGSVLANLELLYGFPAGTPNWEDVVIRVPEFLRRTGLTFCEFLDLWHCVFVKFNISGFDSEGHFRDCEPCYLESLTMVFPSVTPAVALRKLVVFIRLWRRLRSSDAGYSFDALADICKVFRLFDASDDLNPDFIRQLAAFQILRDHFDLPLTEGPATHAGSGSDRTHLLALWDHPAAARHEWALQQLVRKVQHYAQARHKCGCREPEFLKILRENLNPLSKLAGFDPFDEQNGNHQHWNDKPTHTLRFAEVLSKLYASPFQVSEILFLFSADKHVPGDDPFPLSSDNEALESPFDYPDDTSEFDLWALRKKLLAIRPCEMEAGDWTWQRIRTCLETEFSYSEPDTGSAPEDRPLYSLGKYFFPTEAGDQRAPFTESDRHFRFKLPLANTNDPLWNTPFDGPFRYDKSTEELCTQIPLGDLDVSEKLNRIRQLNAFEQAAVNDLFFQPRALLVRFAFLFGDWQEAERRLLEEADEAKRWEYFRKHFVAFYMRCGIIACHLAEHVYERCNDQTIEQLRTLAWKILQSLHADENTPLPTENDAGPPPSPSLDLLPRGSSFAAILGVTGVGLVGEYKSLIKSTVWREVLCSTAAFGDGRNTANAPVPTLIPSLDYKDNTNRFVTIRNGFAIDDHSACPLGGAEGIEATWCGQLLIDSDGKYSFFAGTTTAQGEKPHFGPECEDSWHVSLKRGQKTWVLLSHKWHTSDAPSDCSAPLPLRRGIYELTISFIRPNPQFSNTGMLKPQRTGFELKYCGPDTSNEVVVIPHTQLFRAAKDSALNPVGNDAADKFLKEWYTSSIRDVRRTYQRAFKACLFFARLEIATSTDADDGQSELGYFLSNPSRFQGYSYFKNGGWSTHHAQLYLDLLPVLDNYLKPTATRDRRAKPSIRRQQALFDWWERVFDYTRMRTETHSASGRPVWLLFHEANEHHPDNPIHLLRHMGVDANHAPKVFAYWDQQTDLRFEVTWSELLNEQWPIRIWMAEQWLREIERRIPLNPAAYVAFQPCLWASTDPSIVYPPESVSGNDSLTQVVRWAYLEPKEQAQYVRIERVNNALRQRAQEALLAFVCGIERFVTAIPTIGKPIDGPPATKWVVDTSQSLSDYLLIDVDAGLCQRMSRIESAIRSIQTFVQRARLGLEPSFPVNLPRYSHFARLWDSRFESLCVWQACKRRELFRENWIEWQELEKARKTESFQFLESELRKRTATIPVPGGMEHWPDSATVDRSGIKFIQVSDPSRIEQLQGERDGFDLLGTTERSARPSWLSSLGPNQERTLPSWISSAIKMGRKFVRIAAAGLPTADARFHVAETQPSAACCSGCDDEAPLVDEFYFWIEEATTYTSVAQDSRVNSSKLDGDGNRDEETDWHRPDKLPALLTWSNDGVRRAVSLAWSRFRRGEFEPVRRSSEVLFVSDLSTAELLVTGREEDVIWLTVDKGEPPASEGYLDDHSPGFMYLLARDTAEVVPKVVKPDEATPSIGKLAAYPYFAYFAPGHQLLPSSMFCPTIALANSAMSDCRYEAALHWLERYRSPLETDNSWCQRKTGVSCCAVGAVPNASAVRRAVTLRYIEILMNWGVAEAKRSRYETARVILATASRLLGEAPKRTLLKHSYNWDTDVIASFISNGAGLNPRLVFLYDNVQMQMKEVHACLTASHIRKAESPTTASGCCSVSTLKCDSDITWCLPSSPYRFGFLSQKLIEFASDLRGLGASLLSAFEKGDSEYLAALRAIHERQVLDLSLQIRQLQWREAEWQVQALQKTKESAMTRRRYTDNLIQRGLISKESEYETLTELSMAMLLISQVSEIVSQAMGYVPDFNTGAVGPFPTLLLEPPVGTKLAGIFSAAGRVASYLSQQMGIKAGLDITQAGWQRREEEWRHQVEVLDIEIEQDERQILAAERRRDIALHELNNHQRQIEHSAEVNDFLRDKFTNHALYLWMQQETSALYEQMYHLTVQTARQTEAAFNLERGLSNRTFVSSECWDDLREGLLCGERLQLVARQMEKAYNDENAREHELVKHFSLRSQFPWAFLQLRMTGYCEIDVPEWMFDLDYPGHYMRRIKNVTLTIPCVAGPYTGVHCRMTLLQSVVRKDNRLSSLSSRCCDHDTSDAVGYRQGLNDTRFVTLCGAKEAIATSSGQNDSGMFEVNFRDERYLPFEYSGAISRWRIELPQENNFFDFDSLTDLIIRLSYTAREGGEPLRRAATVSIGDRIPSQGTRLIEVQREFPETIRRRRASDSDHATAEVELQVDSRMFPFVPSNRKIRITGVTVLFTSDPCESNYKDIQFETMPSEREIERSTPLTIRCIADASLANVFIGRIELYSHLHVRTSLGRIAFPCEFEKLVLLYRFEAMR